MIEAPSTTSPALLNEVTRLRNLVRILTERTQQLQHALDSRVAIEQAKGVLAERFGLTIDEAFETLRSAARSSRVELRALASEVVASQTTPAVVETERRRRSARP